MKELLAVENPIKPAEVIINRDWNVGGTIAIAKISETVPAHLLMEIKNECGGLQVE